MDTGGFWGWGEGRPGVMLTTYLHPVPRFSMSGAMPLLPLRLHVAHRCNFCSLLKSSTLWNIFQTCHKCDLIKSIRYGMYSFWYEFTWENRDNDFLFSYSQIDKDKNQTRPIPFSTDAPTNATQGSNLHGRVTKFLVCSKTNAEQ